MAKKLLFESQPWKTIECSRRQLRLDIVLKCGQSFRWQSGEMDTSKNLETWKGVLNSRLWLLAQDEDRIYFKSLANVETEQHDVKGDEDEEEAESILKDYFQLDVDVASLYKRWAEADPVFENISHTFSGVRMLRQDPVENLFSFICSANNNIKRISGMVENLCINYGQVIAINGDEKYYAFPDIDHLADAQGIEDNLRKLGFGYRAAYISKTAKQLQESGGKKYLLSLRKKSYTEAREDLLKLSGIGPKVADCILLMSLDKPDAIPVDTHMFQIAAKSYLPHLKGCKSVTDKVYCEIGNHFRSLYGDYAGWAHSVLFSADLAHLKPPAADNDTNKKIKKKDRKRKSNQI